MDVMKKVPVREQAPDVRNKNFDEVCLGYNKEEAMEEASRCLTCKNAKCVQGCPVSINIPAFIKEVKEGNFAEAYKERGRAKLLNGDKDGSVEDMKRSLELNPKDEASLNGEFKNLGPKQEALPGIF